MNLFDEYSIFQELKHLAKLDNLNETSTEKLRTLVKLKCFQNGQLTKDFDDNNQHDSGEFLQSLLEHLWLEDTQVSRTLREEIFGGVCQDILHCVCGYRAELAIEHMSEIVPIQIIGESIQLGLEDIFREERITRNCPKCKSSSVEKKQLIIQEPSTLILQLMRYKFDSVKKEISKIHKPVCCETSISMPSGTRYTLNSIINHIG